MSADAIFKKTCLVTGASSGIGYYTTLNLAKNKCEIIVLCRTKEKAEITCRNIISASGNQKVSGYHADLSNREEIENAVVKIKSQLNKIDVLIHNAACVSSTRQLTKENIELQFAVNHIAPFLLTHHLLPLLQKSENGRIVLVNSRAHRRGKIHFDDLFFEHGYTLSKAYNQSKLANMLFTYSLAKKMKHTPITVNAFHPGLVKTEIGNKHVSLLDGMAWQVLKFLGRNPEKAAKDGIYLALSNEVLKTTGGYFHNKKKIKASDASYNKTDADKLWNLNLKLCNIDPEFYGEIS